MPDHESIEAYATASTPALARLAAGLTGDRHAAADLVQDTLVKVFVRWTTVSRAQNIDAYVKTMLVRTFISGRRRRQTREIVDSQLVDDRLRDVGASAPPPLDEELRKALLRLPAKQRAVLVLRYLEDQPDEQIATHLGCSPSTVRVHAHRGLGRIRHLIDEGNDHDGRPRAPSPARRR